MPFQSTIDRSVGKLIKSFRNRDYFGGNKLDSAWRTDRRPRDYLNVPTAVHPSGKWDLLRQGNCVFNTGINYGITVDLEAGTGSLPIIIHVWGAGGGAGQGNQAPGGQLASAGGGGGYVSAPMNFPHGTTYNLQVGNAMGNAPGTSPFGEPGASGNPNSPGYSPSGGYSSGGYTAFYEGAISTPNIRLLAGGGGGGGLNDGGSQGRGGGGGNTGVNSGNAQNAGDPTGYTGPANGGGATPTAGGAKGTSPHTNGTDGSALTGGTGGARGGSGAAGGGGGAGWFGGGGGAGQTNINTDGGGGGGGTSYVHPSLVPVATSTGADGRNAANASSPAYVPGTTPTSQTARAQGGIYTPGQPTSYSQWGGPGMVVIELNN